MNWEDAGRPRRGLSPSVSQSVVCQSFMSCVSLINEIGGAGGGGGLARLRVGERPDMMFASEGGGGSWKSVCSKGGCMNFMVKIISKCVQGGGSNKSKNFADIISGSSLVCLISR